jgi:hypothetical protein
VTNATGQHGEAAQRSQWRNWGTLMPSVIKAFPQKISANLNVLQYLLLISEYLRNVVPAVQGELVGEK